MTQSSFIAREAGSLESFQEMWQALEKKCIYIEQSKHLFTKKKTGHLRKKLNQEIFDVFMQTLKDCTIHTTTAE